LKGLQGNTTVSMQGGRGAGGNVALNDRQRTQIRDTVINGRGAPRVGRVDFDVNVGTIVPAGTCTWCAFRKPWCGSTRDGADSSTSSTTMKSSSSTRTT
jgi:hypothetical protein